MAELPLLLGPHPPPLLELIGDADLGFFFAFRYFDFLAVVLEGTETISSFSGLIDLKDVTEHSCQLRAFRSLITSSILTVDFAVDEISSFSVDRAGLIGSIALTASSANCDSFVNQKKRKKTKTGEKER